MRRWTGAKDVRNSRALFLISEHYNCSKAAARQRLTQLRESASTIRELALALGVRESALRAARTKDPEQVGHLVSAWLSGGPFAFNTLQSAYDRFAARGKGTHGQRRPRGAGGAYARSKPQARAGTK